MSEQAMEDPNLYAGGDADDADIETLGGDDRGDAVDETAVATPEPEQETEVKDESAAEEEGAEEGVEEDEGAAEEDAAEEEPEKADRLPPKDDHRIPKHRLDDEIAKRRALERRLADLEAKNTPSEEPVLPDFDFSAKEAEYMEAVLDGESEKAAAIRQEIRQAEKTAYESEFNQRMESTKSQTRAELEMEQVVTELVQQYDIFNTDSENFDADLTQEAVQLRDTFMAQGYGVRDALNKATRYVLAANHPEMLGLGEQQEAPAPAPAKQSLGKKVAVANKQPPPLSDTAGARGNNVHELDVNKISEDDFDALPDSKLAELRGDVV